MIATRPDLALPVGKMSQFCESLASLHHSSVKLIFRFMKGILKHGICFSRSEPLKVHGFSHSICAKYLKDRKSTSAFIFKIAGEQLGGSLESRIW